MRILMIFGLVFGVMLLTEYLGDTIQQYYNNKDEEEMKKKIHILGMKL